VRQIEARDPLPVQILHTLSTLPATPTDLAEKLGVAKPTISRHLGTLRKERLVRREKVFGDGRQWRYLLTADGEIQLGQHRAFGTPQPAPPLPSDAEAVAFMRAALDRAVEGRRKSNRLGEAAARLRAVASEAERSGFHDVALDANAELMITLRQDRQVDEVNELLEALGQIALGHDERYGSELVLPAAAHRDYTLGRVATETGGDELVVRARYLVTAATSYEQLGDAEPPGKAGRWVQRQAWSIASLASNLREQSRFERALTNASYAMRLFEELDDSYGRSYCLFLLGFCWRLLGDFDEAWQRLNEAHEIAAHKSFARFEADALMQMGEVRRCQGKTSEARGLLEQALKGATDLELVVTTAFAHSALGALEYQDGRLDEACAALARAHEQFQMNRHREGIALNARRQAIVARQLASGSSEKNFKPALALIADATGRYTALRSPAGVVACHIEDARLHMRCEGNADAQIATVIERLDKDRGRDLLQRDPWLPHLLVTFASDFDHDDLQARGKSLMAESAWRRVAELSYSYAPRATPAGSLAPPTAAEVGDERFEMGGETRFDTGRVPAHA
jgi:DNA-binding MarR family transcriptional regulator